MKKMISDRYMLMSSLGEGGMADVYLALDTILNREVAVKILRGELGKDPVALLRFQREASAVSKLHHPNVVDVYDVGEYEGRHYIVMEYVRGRTLKQMISQRGALSQKEAVSIMKQLVSAVQHAHEHNIIHRDIKPQNVLVTDDGTVKITDFGIALAHDVVQLTRDDAVLGSAHYLAPETTKGETINHQVDIYALGIVFYELLRGSVPFKGDSPVQIAMKHLREEIPSIREFNPTVYQSVENIIIKATVKNRMNRYQSAKEMLYDLEHCMDEMNKNVEKLTFPVDDDPTIDIRNKKVNKEVNKGKKENASVKGTKKKKRKPMGIIVMVLLIVLISFLLFVTAFGSNKIVQLPDVRNQTIEAAKQELIELGFSENNIKIEEAYTDDIEKGIVYEMEPSGEKRVQTKDGITLKVSKGMYYTLEDYTYQNFEEVKQMLEEKVPYLHVSVEYKQTTQQKAGYIIEQSGISVGEKLDPDKVYELKLVVTQSVSFKIEGFVGKRVEEVKAMLEEKGISPVLHAMPLPEGETAESGVVVKVDPQEGSWYTQEGDNVITLYYYEEG